MDFLSPSLSTRYADVLGATYVMSAHRGAIRYYPSVAPDTLYAFAPNLSWAGEQYMKPMVFPAQRPFWLPIYTDPATGRLMSSVVQPLILGRNQHYYGDHGTDVFLSSLQSVVGEASRLAGGYAMLIDPTGNLFASDQLTLNAMFCPNGTHSQLSLAAHMCTGANGTFDFAAPNPSGTPIGTAFAALNHVDSR